MVMKPVKVNTVFWVYIVSWVIKLKKLNKLFRRNEPRYRNRETRTNWRGN
jgi:hypothetical protein